MASKALIYSISRSLLFCLSFIPVHNYPKLTDSYIFETDKVRKINMRVCMGIHANKRLT